MKRPRLSKDPAAAHDKFASQRASGFDSRPNLLPANMPSPRFFLIGTLLLCIRCYSSFGQSYDAPPNALYSPRPDYPKEAKQKHLTGSGVLVLRVDKASGKVTSAKMEKSTGHKILDDSAIRAFKNWSFQSGKFSVVHVPITYTLNRDHRPAHTEHARAIYSPRPEYPHEARRQGVTGRGIFALNIDYDTDFVVSVEIRQTTGHQMLDHAAIATLKKWRFRPRTFYTVVMPLAFTITDTRF